MRVSEKVLNETFDQLVEQATSAGIDTSRWRFGRPYGDTWVLEVPGHLGVLRKVQSGWSTNREAFTAMSAMISAFYIVERHTNAT